MKAARVVDVSRRVQEMLERAAAIPDAGGRVEWISSQFLGFPYIHNPLVGAADVREVFTASLDGFDCVTYMETALALARSRSERDFPGCLKDIRYRAGKVDWRSRNHYMTDWIENNVRNGAVRRVAFQGSQRTKERLLDAVPGLVPRRRRFSCLPKQALRGAASAQIRSGDLIFFASTRPHLDVFHCGILIRDGGRLLLRHASRSQGRVVEQDLGGFLSQNRMAGVIVVRPAERSVR